MKCVEKKDLCYGTKVLGTNVILDISCFIARLKQRHCLNCGKKRDFRDYFQVSSLISVSVNPPLIVQDLGKGDSGE